MTHNMATNLRTVAAATIKEADGLKDSKTLFGLKQYHTLMARAYDQQMLADNYSSDEDNSVDETDEHVKTVEDAYGGKPDIKLDYTDLTLQSAALMVKNGEMSREEFKLVIDNGVPFRMKV